MNILLAALGTTISDQAKAQELASAAVSTLWSDIFKRGLFGEITYAFSGIAVIAMMFYLVQLVAKSADDDFEFNPSKLIYTLVLVILLSQRGAIAMYCYVGTVQISNNIVARLTGRIASDLNIVGLSMAAQEDTEVAQKVKQLFDECRLIADPNDVALKEQCITTKKGVLQSMISSGQITNPETVARLQKVLGSTSEEIQNGGNNWLTNPMGAASDAFQDAFKLILFGLSVAMYYAIEISMILVGLALPPALAFGMMGKGALVAWFTSFWSLVNMKLAYAIVMAIVSFLQVSLQNSSGGVAIQSFLIEILAGIFAPFIASLYAAANGIGLLNALGQFGLGAGRAAASAGAATAGGLVKGGVAATRLADRKLNGGRIGSSMSGARSRVQKWWNSTK